MFPSVRPTFQNIAKQSKRRLKIIITNGGKFVGLTKEIIDDTCLVFFPACSTPFKIGVRTDGVADDGDEEGDNAFFSRGTDMALLSNQ